MKIIVCFKILPDPDRILDSDWENFSLTRDISYAGVDFNCFDRSALEIGLSIKQQAAVQGVRATCTALTVWDSLPQSFTESLYAVGFDEVVCIPAKNREFCPEQVAQWISEGASRGDLILTGTEAGMAQTGMVPYFLGEKLGIPVIGGVESAALEENALRVTCHTQAGASEKKVQLPAVCAVGNSPEVLRCATLRARMQCRGKAPTVLPVPEEFSAPVPKFSRPDTERECTMLDPENPETLQKILSLLRKGTGESRDAGDGEKMPPLPALKVIPADASEEACEAVLATEEKLVLLPDTESGRRLATCLGLKKDYRCFFGGEVKDLTDTAVTVSKRVFGANLVWKKEISLPAAVTCPADVFASLAAEKTLKLPKGEQPKWLLEEKILPDGEKQGLSGAKILIACGCGMGSKAECDRAAALADELGAGFGLTRPAALNAWGSVSRIIGQSGAVTAPECCLVLGTAGAGAFLVGIEKAKTVIAVNTDPNALIFKHADFGVQTDAVRFLEKLAEEAGKETL